MINLNDSCWGGSSKKWKNCPHPVQDKASPSEVVKEYWNKYQIIIKNEKQVEGIRAASKLAAQILEATCKLAKPGITTEELNAFAHKLHLEAGAIPAPLHYGSPPYPKSICTSINEVICHGIPSQTVLREGDILNIDVTSKLKGYFGDCSRMVAIGKVSSKAQKLIDTCYEATMLSIGNLKPGVLISEIGNVIEQYASARDFSVVYQFVGHGVGVNFHEAPQVFHCKNNVHIPLVPGMIFTIEPMLNEGAAEGYVDEDDSWTVRTMDGKLSAQWEHTLLITEKGYEVLTLP